MREVGRGGSLRWLTLVATAALFAVPFVYLAARGLAEADATWNEITQDRVLGPLRRTIVLAAIVTTAATTLGVVMAWVCARTDVPGRRLLRVAAVVPLVIPSFVAAQTIVSAFSPGGLLDDIVGWTPAFDIRGLDGAAVVLTLLTYPYVYLPVLARFATLPPSLEESARLLGHDAWHTFRRVVLPQSWPTISSGALLVALYTVSDFGAVQFVGYDTLTRTIFANQLDPVRSISMSLVLAVLALAITLVERRGREMTGLVAPATATSPRTTRLVPLGNWRVAVAGQRELERGRRQVLLSGRGEQVLDESVRELGIVGGVEDGDDATVTFVEYYGHDVLVSCALPDGRELHARSTLADLDEGDRVGLRCLDVATIGFPSDRQDS